jgi:hypothetical protein
MLLRVMDFIEGYMVRVKSDNISRLAPDSPVSTAYLTHK